MVFDLTLISGILLLRVPRLALFNNVYSLIVELYGLTVVRFFNVSVFLSLAIVKYLLREDSIGLTSVVVRADFGRSGDIFFGSYYGLNTGLTFFGSGVLDVDAYHVALKSLTGERSF